MNESRNLLKLLVGRQGLEPWTIGLKARPSDEELRLLTSPALQAGAIDCTGDGPTALYGPSFSRPKPWFWKLQSCAVAEG
jgi:hypothetical protein